MTNEFIDKMISYASDGKNNRYFDKKVMSGEYDVIKIMYGYNIKCESNTIELFPNFELKIYKVKDRKFFGSIVYVLVCDIVNYQKILSENSCYEDLLNKVEGIKELFNFLNE